MRKNNLTRNYILLIQKFEKLIEFDEKKSNDLLKDVNDLSGKFVNAKLNESIKTISNKIKTHIKELNEFNRKLKLYNEINNCNLDISYKQYKTKQLHDENLSSLINSFAEFAEK